MPKSNTDSLERIILHLVRVVVACLIMMWGVINVVHNFLSWRKLGWEEASSWMISVGFIFVTGVLPLVVGIWMLFRIQQITNVRDNR